MTWANPHLLWLLLGVVALALMTWRWHVIVRRTRAGIGAGVPHLTASVGHKREVLRSLLLWSGLALLVVAIAGPRWGARIACSTKMI